MGDRSYFCLNILLLECYLDVALNPITKWLLRSMVLNRLSNPDFVAFSIDGLPNEKVAAYRNSSLPILGWTVKDLEHLEKAKEFCDNIVFENITP